MALKTRKRKRNAQPTQPQLRLQEERVTELLDIAAEEFIAHGLEGASINRIVRRANASKTTFYSRFPTKEKLFTAVLERRINFVFREMSAALPIDRPIEKSLREYGSKLVNLLFSEQYSRLLRVVSMEAQRFPELGEHFYELGPKRGHALLSAFFEEQIRRGGLAKEDPALMAEHFMNLVTGGPLRRIVLGLNHKLTSDDTSRDVDSAVRVFLRAYAPESAKRGRAC